MDITEPPPADEARAGGDAASPPPPFRLRRACHGVLGGVCAGISVATGVDVTLVRLAFIITGISGIGVLAYVVLFFVLPKEDPAHGAFVMSAPADVARWLRAALVVAPLLSVTGWLGARSIPFGWRHWGHDRGPGIGLGIVLAALGIGIIWLRRRPRSTWWARPAVEPAPSTAPEPGLSSGPTAPPQPSGSPSGRSRWARWRGCARSTSAALLVARVAAWLAVVVGVTVAALTLGLERIGALSISTPVLFAAVAVAALAALVVAAARVRQPWWLVASVTVLVVPALTGLALGHWVGGVGDRIEAPTTIAQVRPSYRLALGHLTVDLTHITLDGKTLDVAADTRIGLLDVIAPAGAQVKVDAHVGIGELQVLDHSHHGIGLDQHVDDAPPVPSGAVMVHAHMAFGQVRVCRAPSAGQTVSATCSAVLNER